MPEQEKNLSSILLSPQVVAALITSAVALLAAIVPSLLSDDDASLALTVVPTQPPTQVVAASTPLPPSATPLPMQPTMTPTPLPASTTPLPPSATPLPASATPLPPSATPLPPPTATDPPATTPPNVILLYDDVAFTIYNDTQQTLSLDGVQFISENRRWDATDWGTTLVASFPADNCLRMRDATTGNRQPPAICGNLLGFVQVGASALFWLEGDSFEVRKNGTWLASCNTAQERCPVYIPQ